MKDQLCRILPAALAALLLALGVIPAASATASTVAAARTAGEVTDLGEPLDGVTVHEGAYGPGPNGKTYGYALVGGTQAKFGVIDAADGSEVASFPMPGASGGWAITVDDDGAVYVGSYFQGRLYRYTPADDNFEDLGSPFPVSTTNQYIWSLAHAPDGTVYGGTYPGAKLFAYHPDTRTFETIASLAVGKNEYLRAVAVDPDRQVVYASTGIVTNRLYKVDLRTRAVTEIPVDPALMPALIIDLRYLDDKLFFSSNARLVALDADTLKPIPLTDGETGARVLSTQSIARGVSSPVDGVVYFNDVDPAAADQSTESPQQRLMRLDLSTMTFRPAPIASGPAHLPRAAIGLGWSDGPNGPVLHSFVGNFHSLGFSYDITTKAMSVLDYQLPRGPVGLANLIAGPDGEVYLSSGQNGEFGRFWPATGRSERLPRTNQVEQFLWDDGKLYQGMYPDGNLQVWDPADPGTVKVLMSLKKKERQNRPFSLAADDKRIFVGTSPDYGHTLGALTVYDKATGQHATQTLDNTVSALARIGSVLAVGTSRDLGAGPLATPAARMYLTDPANPRLDKPIAAVPSALSYTAFTVGPDGLLWGLADGTVFAVDVRTRTVVRTIVLNGDTTGARNGRLFFAPNGKLYAGLPSARIFEIDPDLGAFTQLPLNGISATLGTDGMIYAGSGSHLYRMPTPAAAGRDLVTTTPVVPIRPGGAQATISVVLRGTLPQDGVLKVGGLPDGWDARAVAVKTPDGTGFHRRQVELTVTAPADARTAVSATVAWKRAGEEVSVPVELRPITGYAATVVADGPAGYWPLNETAGTRAIDYAGSHADASYLFGAVPGAQGTVAGETAANLTNGYLTVARQGALNLAGPFTVEAWVLPPPSSPGPGRAIVESYSGNADGFAFRLVGGRLQGIVLGADGVAVVNGSTALPAGRWAHVALVYDGAALSTYVDGVRDAALATPKAPTAGPATIKIGARGDDANQRWGSSLQHVALYPKALDANLLRAHIAAANRQPTEATDEQ